MTAKALSNQKGTARKALHAAFPHTLPIFAGFWFLGMTYGIYMNVSGFSFWYPMLMSMTIFAGSMEFVTLLNQCYWVFGATLGGLFGSLIRFNTEGIDFVMTAMFVVIFLEQWGKDKNHIPALLGLGLSLLCLMAFGPDNFIIPAMLFILLSLSLARKPLENERGCNTQ